MKLSAFLILFFTYGFANAASSVIPLFDDSGFRIGTTIPFRMNGFASAAYIRQLSLSDSSACQSSVDPYDKQVFLLKCTSATSVKITITMREGNDLRNVVYGPITVAALKTGYTEPPRTTQPSGDDRGYQGRAYMLAYSPQSCFLCHTTPTSPRNLIGKTAAQIKAAYLSSGSTMSTLPRPSDADLEKISVFLGDPDSFGGWP